MSSIKNIVVPFVVSLSLAFALVSCKNKKETKGKSVEEIQVDTKEKFSELEGQRVRAEEANEWKQKHRNLLTNFQTLQISAEVDYKDASMSQTVEADIQIDRGREILITLRAFFITVGKIYISPERVSYYEVVNRSHYDGSFQLISQKLGVPLNYQQVENILLGQTVLEFEKAESMLKGADEVAFSQAVGVSKLLASFTSKGVLKEQLVMKKSDELTAQMQYGKFAEKEGVFLPEIFVVQTMGKGAMRVQMNYKKIKLNQKLRIKYEIPSNSEGVRF